MTPGLFADSFRRARAVAVYEFLWDVRKWRTYVVVPLVMLVAVLIGLGPRLLPGGFSGVDPATWWESTLSVLNTSLLSGIFPLLVGGFLATDSLAMEFDKGTIAGLFAQPVRRAEIYLGKVLEKGIFLLALAALTVALAVGASELSSGAQSDLAWAAAFALSMLLVFLMFAALAFFLGSVIHSGTIVLGALLGLYFALIIGSALLFLQYGFGYWLYFVPVFNCVGLVPALQAYIAHPGGTTTINVNFVVAGRSAIVGNALNLELSLVGVILGIVVLFLVGYLTFRRAEVTG
ncbi:MAG: ABC transporter permease [Thermoplasmata archaeon]